MTPRERTVAVLNRWCGGDFVDHTAEKLEDLWSGTKPTGKPSHDGIDFFAPGAEDLVDRLIAEFETPPARKINFDASDLDPKTGGILTVDDLFRAVNQSRPLPPTAMLSILSPESHRALVDEIVGHFKRTKKTAAEKQAAPAPKKTPARKKAAARKKSTTRRKNGRS
jgi:hypothetical protein